MTDDDRPVTASDLHVAAMQDRDRIAARLAEVTAERDELALKLEEAQERLHAARDCISALALILGSTMVHTEVIAAARRAVDTITQLRGGG